MSDSKPCLPEKKPGHLKYPKLALPKNAQEVYQGRLVGSDPQRLLTDTKNDLLSRRYQQKLRKEESKVLNNHLEVIKEKSGPKMVESGGPMGRDPRWSKASGENIRSEPSQKFDTIKKNKKILSERQPNF